jgi:hypothetical protein
MSKPILTLVILAAFGLATPAAAQILKTEPPMGALREGQVVLVDDGTCGPGKIKKVVGGNHREAGGFSNIKRQRVCIQRR